MDLFPTLTVISTGENTVQVHGSKLLITTFSYLISHKHQ